MRKLVLITFFLLLIVPTATASYWTRPAFWFYDGFILNISYPYNINIKPRNFTAENLFGTLNGLWNESINYPTKDNLDTNSTADRTYTDVRVDSIDNHTKTGNETTRVNLIIDTYIPNNSTADRTYTDVRVDSIDNHTKTGNETTRVNLIIDTYIPNNSTADRTYTDIRVDSIDNHTPTVDSNASTACIDGDYLDGGGLCIDFNETVESYLVTTYFNASSISTITGTSQGVLADIQNFNGYSYNVSETASDFDLRVNFTGITEFNQVVYRYKTELDEPHIMHVRIWSYPDNDWHGIAEEGIREHFGVFTYPIYDEENHIGTGDDAGIVQLQFYTTNPSPPKTHKWEFDWVIISNGIATPSSSESDPFSVHRNGVTPLTGNWNAGAFNIIANSFIGGLNCLNITGATSDLCTLVDTDTTINNCSIDQSCDNIIYTTDKLYNTSLEIRTVSWANATAGEWITPAYVLDIDKEDIETDLNTFVDIAGDTMTGPLQTTKLNITDLTNCDTIDTDANGVLSCGTDDSGDSGGSGNCSVTNSCSNIIYETELDDLSELNTQIGDAVFVDTGTMANGKFCKYVSASTDIICNYDETDASHDECSEISNCVANAWDANADISANEISESKIDFDTTCATGSALYVNGDNLACTSCTGTWNTIDGDGNCDTFLGSLLGDTTPQLSGPLDTNGQNIGSTSDEIEHIYITTNYKIYLGTGQEGEVYYDGSKLIIKVN